MIDWFFRWLTQAPNEMKICFGGRSRSARWPSVRAEHLAIHPRCAACDSPEDLEAHHIIPFHLSPSRELDKDNLLTMCRRCHLLLGHLTDWSSYNEHAREDCAALFTRIRQRP